MFTSGASDIRSSGCSSTSPELHPNPFVSLLNGIIVISKLSDCLHLRQYSSRNHAVYGLFLASATALVIYQAVTSLTQHRSSQRK